MKIIPLWNTATLAMTASFPRCHRWMRNSLGSQGPKRREKATTKRKRGDGVPSSHPLQRKETDKCFTILLKTILNCRSPQYPGYHTQRFFRKGAKQPIWAKTLNAGSRRSSEEGKREHAAALQERLLRQRPPHWLHRPAEGGWRWHVWNITSRRPQSRAQGAARAHAHRSQGPGRSRGPK